MAKEKNAFSRPTNVDEYDKRILNILSIDGRVSISELAKRINLSKTPTLSRDRRLEKEGIIVGYRAVLQLIELGLDHVAFVEVTLHDTREAALQAFNLEVAKVHEIEQCHMIAGNFDYLLKVRTHSLADYRRVLGEKISTLPHVAQTKTFVAMQAVKDGELNTSF